MTEERRTPDDDLRAAIDEHLELSVGDVVDVVAQVPGEADEANWYWIVRLGTGRWALITGGCDYTGWECQSHADLFTAESPEAAAALAKDTPSRRNVSIQLLAQLRGTQPYATYAPRHSR